MRNKTKITLSLFLIVGFIAITGSQLLSQVSCHLPYDDDPNDPGNGMGPGDYPPPDDPVEPNADPPIDDPPADDPTPPPGVTPDSIPTVNFEFIC